MRKPPKYNVIKQPITLPANRSHRFTTDTRFIGSHLTVRVFIGDVIIFNGEKHRVKDIVKKQPSKYYKNHTYYEVIV